MPFDNYRPNHVPCSHRCGCDRYVGPVWAFDLCPFCSAWLCPDCRCVRCWACRADLHAIDTGEECRRESV